MQKFTFAYEGTEYSIPSPLFPLTSPDNINVFSERGMSEITDGRMIKIINSLDFEAGSIYENAEKLDVTLLASGFNSFFFSGWLFAGAFPIHHAWVIVVHNDKYHLIDPTFHQVSYAVVSKIRGRGDVRDDFKKYWKEELGKRGENIERIVAGVPTGNLLYVGNPDNSESAEEIYLDLSKDKHHPSYQGGVNFRGDSELQIYIRQ